MKQVWPRGCRRWEGDGKDAGSLPEGWEKLGGRGGGGGGMREPGLGPALDPEWAGEWRRGGAPPAERVVARGPVLRWEGPVTRH